YGANIAFFLGRAARSCRDRQLLSRLLDLLADPADPVVRDKAIAILFDMEQSPAFDLLLAGVPAQRVPILAQLAAVAASTQVACPQGVEQSCPLGPDARASIHAILAECSSTGQDSPADQQLEES